MQSETAVDEKTYAGFGRPTAYRPEFVLAARALADRGATDDEIADFFGVHRSTLYRWKHEHPDFCDAITIGKAPADDRTERSLYQQAVGHYVIEQEAHKIRKQTAPGVFEERVEVVEVQKYVPPVPAAAIFWLKNRRPKDWRDTKQIEQSGPNGSPILEARTVKFIIVDPKAPEVRTIEGEAVSDHPTTASVPARR